MNKIYLLPKDTLGEAFYRRIYLLVRKNGWDSAAIGAAFGIAGGMLSIILGALLWAIIPLLASTAFGSFLNVLETVFFILSLPLLVLGAYCLDLLEKRPPAISLSAKSQPAGFESRYRFRARLPHQN